MKRSFLGAPATVLMLAMATTALAQVDPIADANRRKAEADADTAASNADKARSEAATAAAKAKLGPLADYTAAGTTTAGNNAGKTESQLLASDATQGLAKLMVERLKLQSLNKANILITSEGTLPTFEAYDAFLAQLQQIEGELKRAQLAKPKAKSAPTKLIQFEMFGSSSAAVVLNTVGNLLRSDYQVAGVEWTADDALLSRAIIVQAKSNSFIRKFYTPAVSPLGMAKTNLAIEALANLTAEQARAEDKLEAVTVSSQSSTELDYSEVIVGLEASIKRGEAFAAMLRTPKDGVTPLVVVARQAHFARILQDGYILSIKTHAAGGSTYTKKNFWTFLGTLPFYVSGGALASYSLTDGVTGEVLDSAVFGRMRPYMKVHDVASKAGGGASSPE